MCGNKCGRKWSWLNLRYYIGIFLKGLRKTTRILRVLSVQTEIRSKHPQIQVRNITS
jgi:hypothetical protein